MITEPGFHDIPEADYHADKLCEKPSLSRTIAKKLLDLTPAHARASHPRLCPDYQEERKRIYDLGHAAEALVLRGEEAFVELDFGNFQTKAAREQRDAAYEVGKIPLLVKDADDVRGMALVARRQLASHEIGDVFAEGKADQTLVWFEDGFPMRCRFDWLPQPHPDLVEPIDFKTTSGSAGPDVWSRRVFEDGLDLQDAFYCRGLQKALKLDRRPVMTFVVQEVKPPFALCVHRLSPEAHYFADEKIEKAIRIWKRCLSADSWPGYPNYINYVDPPPWVSTKWEHRKEVAKMLDNAGTDEIRAAMLMQAPLEK